MSTLQMCKCATILYTFDNLRTLKLNLLTARKKSRLSAAMSGLMQRGLPFLVVSFYVPYFDHPEDAILDYLADHGLSITDAVFCPADGEPTPEGISQCTETATFDAAGMSKYLGRYIAFGM